MRERERARERDRERIQFLNMFCDNWLIWSQRRQKRIILYFQTIGTSLELSARDIENSISEFEFFSNTFEWYNVMQISWNLFLINIWIMIEFFDKIFGKDIPFLSSNMNYEGNKNNTFLQSCVLQISQCRIPM